MKRIVWLSVIGALMFATGVVAADAKKLNVTQSVELNVPAAKAWAMVNNFGDLGAWHPAVAKTEIVEGSNNQKGAVRSLTLQDGGKIQERLLAYDPKAMSYQYQIIEGVLPVSNYVSTLSVKPMGADKSVATWKGSFKRKDTSAQPAAGQNDEAAVSTITSVYRGGLDNLKKQLEAN